jgi:hypothetical protein
MERKDGKIKYNRRMRYALLGGLGVMMIMVGAMFAVTFSANEATKESHVKGNDLVGLNGLPVKTKAVETYAKLFDLPKFDISTLAQIKQLTLKMHDGLQATLAITKVTKETGSAMTKLYTATQDTVTIDADSRIVMANIDGKCHTVDVAANDVAVARRLFAEEAKLYSAEDFFALDDFVGNSRKLADTSKMTGFASVALAASEAILDAAKASGYTAEDSMAFEGNVRDTAGGCAPIMDMRTWLDGKTDESKVEAVVDNTRTITHMLTKKQGYEYKYARAAEDAAWTLNACEIIEFNDVAATGPAELVDMKAKVVAHHGNEFAVKAGDKLIVGKATFGALADDIVVTPTPKECQVIWSAKVATMDPSDGAARRLGATPRKLGLKSNSQLWWASQCAYKGNCAGTGTECSRDNANAKVITVGGKSVLAFAGTDGLSDFGDWIDNLNIGTKSTSSGNHHEGFFNYQNKISGCNSIYSGTYDYVVGHSLGGASATVFCKVNPSRCGKLVTFGAPKSRKNGDRACSASGTRYFHENDPITSDGTHLIRVLGGFQHDVTSAKRVYKNTGSCYCGSTFGSCHRSGYWLSCGWRGCSSGYHCNNGGRRPDTKHSVSASCGQEGNRQNVISAGLNFMGIHTQYADFLPDNLQE